VKIRNRSLQLSSIVFLIALCSTSVVRAQSHTTNPTANRRLLLTTRQLVSHCNGPANSSRQWNNTPRHCALNQMSLALR
jgi:hypothetical protein